MKGLFVNFRNLYGFLSQVIPYQDSDLEKLYTYLRFLLTKLPQARFRSCLLPGRRRGTAILPPAKNQRRPDRFTGGKADPLKGPNDVGTGRGGDDEIRLSELIDYSK